MKKFLTHIEEYLCCVLFMGMLGLAFTNVVFRYLLSASISFTEEIICAGFVLLCMLGTAIVAKNQAHLSVSVLVERMSERNRNIFALIANILSIIFCLILIDTGLDMTIRQYQVKQITIALQWPEWIYGACLPFGATMMAIRFGQAAIDRFKKLRYKEMN
jgi:C4-dicarboxylate transporter DctQ subunit